MFGGAADERKRVPVIASGAFGVAPPTNGEESIAIAHCDQLPTSPHPLGEGAGGRGRRSRRICFLRRGTLGVAPPSDRESIAIAHCDQLPTPPSPLQGRGPGGGAAVRDASP